MQHVPGQGKCEGGPETQHPEADPRRQWEVPVRRWIAGVELRVPRVSLLDGKASCRGDSQQPVRGTGGQDGQRAGEEVQRAPFDLAEIAAKAIMDRRPEAGQRGIRIDTAFDRATATGDPNLASSLVANLVDNAIRHNFDGGQIEISTATTSGQATLAISNTGAVIPPGEIGRLFQPFQRLGPERTGHAGGHGLGLAIVHAIADGHGATLTTTTRPDGGLDIQVGFPLPSGEGARSRT